MAPGQGYRTFPEVPEDPRPPTRKWLRVGAVLLVALGALAGVALVASRRPTPAWTLNFVRDTHPCEPWSKFCHESPGCLAKYHSSDPGKPVSKKLCKDYKADCNNYCRECDCGAPEGKYCDTLFEFCENEGKFVTGMPSPSGPKCPYGFLQIGPLGSSIKGCGLDECDNRDTVNSIERCSLLCKDEKSCKAFSFVHDRRSRPICSRYSTVIPNGVRAPADSPFGDRILCKRMVNAPMAVLNPACEFKEEGSSFLQDDMLYPACPRGYHGYGLTRGGFCCKGACKFGREGLGQGETVCAMRGNPTPDGVRRCPPADKTKTCMWAYGAKRRQRENRFKYYTIKAKMLFKGDYAGFLLRMESSYSASAKRYWMKFQGSSTGDQSVHLTYFDGVVEKDVYSGAVTSQATSGRATKMFKWGDVKPGGAASGNGNPCSGKTCKVWNDRSYTFTNRGTYGDDCYYLYGPNNDKNTDDKEVQTKLFVPFPSNVYLDFWGDTTRGSSAHTGKGFKTWSAGWELDENVGGVSFTPGYGPGKVYKRRFDRGEIELMGNDGKGHGTYLVFVCPIKLPRVSEGHLHDVEIRVQKYANCPFPKLKQKCSRPDMDCSWQHCCPTGFSNKAYGANSERCGTGVLGDRRSEGWGQPREACEEAGGRITGKAGNWQCQAAAGAKSITKFSLLVNKIPYHTWHDDQSTFGGFGLQTWRASMQVHNLEFLDEMGQPFTTFFDGFAETQGNARFYVDGELKVTMKPRKTRAAQVATDSRMMALEMDPVPAGVHPDLVVYKEQRDTSRRNIVGGQHFWPNEPCEDPQAKLRSKGRCWQSTLAKAQAICSRHVECVGITRDNGGYEPRGCTGSCFAHHPAAHQLWVKASKTTDLKPFYYMHVSKDSCAGTDTFDCHGKDMADGELMGYVLLNPGLNTVSMRVAYSAQRHDTCTGLAGKHCEGHGYKAIATEGFILTKQEPGTVPLYYMYDHDLSDSQTGTRAALSLNPSTAYQVESNGWFPGWVKRSASCAKSSKDTGFTGTVRECQRKCDLDPKCMGFVMNKKSARCYLRTDAGRGVCNEGVAQPGDAPCDATWCSYDKVTSARWFSSTGKICVQSTKSQTHYNVHSAADCKAKCTGFFKSGDRCDAYFWKPTNRRCKIYWGCSDVGPTISSSSWQGEWLRDTNAELLLGYIPTSRAWSNARLPAFAYSVRQKRGTAVHVLTTDFKGREDQRGKYFIFDAREVGYALGRAFTQGEEITVYNMRTGLARKVTLNGKGVKCGDTVVLPTGKHCTGSGRYTDDAHRGDWVTGDKFYFVGITRMQSSVVPGNWLCKVGGREDLTDKHGNKWNSPEYDHTSAGWVPPKVLDPEVDFTGPVNGDILSRGTAKWLGMRDLPPTVYSYEGCFSHKSQSLADFVLKRNPSSSSDIDRSLTWDDCADKAKEINADFFVEEYPQGNGDANSASCGLPNDRSIAKDGALSKAKCAERSDHYGHAMGGANMMALYKKEAMKVRCVLDVHAQQFRCTDRPAEKNWERWEAASLMPLYLAYEEGDFCMGTPGLKCPAKTSKVDIQGVGAAPKTEAECKTACEQEGLTIGGKGHAFSGSYMTKGCYAYSTGPYKGRCYWGGAGATTAEPSAAKKRAGQYRVKAVIGKRDICTDKGTDCCVIGEEKMGCKTKGYVAVPIHGSDCPAKRPSCADCSLKQASNGYVNYHCIPEKHGRLSGYLLTQPGPDRVAFTVRVKKDAPFNGDTCGGIEGGIPSSCWAEGYSSTAYGGYLLKKQQPGTKPLYSAYSGRMSDHCVAREGEYCHDGYVQDVEATREACVKDPAGCKDKFSGGVLLGYIPTSPDWTPQLAPFYSTYKLGNSCVGTTGLECHGKKVTSGSLIGYVLTQPGPGRVRLAVRHNSQVPGKASGDTCAGTGDTTPTWCFSQGYEDTKHGGYVLKHQLPGTKALYAAYSGRMKDTCVGLANKYCHDGRVNAKIATRTGCRRDPECLKKWRGGVLLGYIPTSPEWTANLLPMYSKSVDGDACVGTADAKCNGKPIESLDVVKDKETASELLGYLLDKPGPSRVKVVVRVKEVENEWTELKTKTCSKFHQKQDHGFGLTKEQCRRNCVMGRRFLTTPEGCYRAALEDGLQPGGDGYNFEGNYAIKGCYAYHTANSAGKFLKRAYFGTGGNDAEMMRPLKSSQKATRYRLKARASAKVNCNAWVVEKDGRCLTFDNCVSVGTGTGTGAWIDGFKAVGKGECTNAAGKSPAYGNLDGKDEGYVRHLCASSRHCLGYWHRTGIKWVVYCKSQGGLCDQPGDGALDITKGKGDSTTQCFRMTTAKTETCAGVASMFDKSQMASADWTIMAAKFRGPVVSGGVPVDVTLKFNVGNGVWILGAVDMGYLRMVKIEITGDGTTYNEKTVKTYQAEPGRWDPACGKQETFNELCFTGSTGDWQEDTDGWLVTSEKKVYVVHNDGEYNQVAKGVTNDLIQGSTPVKADFLKRFHQRGVQVKDDAACVKHCKSLGYGCSDYKISQNQMLSCAQACHMRTKLKVSKDKCLSYCDRDGQSGCSLKVKGATEYTFKMCGTCKDPEGKTPLGKVCNGICDQNHCRNGCRVSTTDEFNLDDKESKVASKMPALPLQADFEGALARNPNGEVWVLHNDMTKNKLTTNILQARSRAKLVPQHVLEKFEVRGDPDYAVKKTPKVERGNTVKHCSGTFKWPGTVEKAIDYAISECDLDPGKDFTTVEAVSGMTYFYGAGKSKGKGGDELWTVTKNINWDVKKAVLRWPTAKLACAEQSVKKSAEHKGKTVEECRALCQKDKECYGFNYCPEGVGKCGGSAVAKTCVLKTALCASGKKEGTCEDGSKWCLHLKKLDVGGRVATCVDKKWPGSIEKAIDLARTECHLAPGKDFLSVEKLADGKVSFYGANNGQQSSGEEVWRVSLKPKYTVKKTPKAKKGLVLKPCTDTSGPKCCSGVDWQGTIEKAIAFAQSPICAFTPGKDLSKVEHLNGKVYFYGPGRQSGAGGEDTWTFEAPSLYRLGKIDSRRASTMPQYEIVLEGRTAHPIPVSLVSKRIHAPAQCWKGEYKTTPSTGYLLTKPFAGSQAVYTAYSASKKDSCVGLKGAKCHEANVEDRWALVLAAKAGEACPKGSTQLKTLEECKAAAKAQGYAWRDDSEGNHGNLAKGCVLNANVASCKATTCPKGVAYYNPSGAWGKVTAGNNICAKDSFRGGVLLGYMPMTSDWNPTLVPFYQKYVKGDSCSAAAGLTCNDAKLTSTFGEVGKADGTDKKETRGEVIGYLLTAPGPDVAKLTVRVNKKAKHGGDTCSGVSGMKFNPKDREAADNDWQIVTPGTKLAGPSINWNTPLDVTLKYDLGDGVHIVGLVEGGLLKMVKIRVLSEHTWTPLATRYRRAGEWPASCGQPHTFNSGCFKGVDPGNAYPVHLVATKNHLPAQCWKSDYTSLAYGGYVLKNQLPGTEPLYHAYSGRMEDSCVGTAGTYCHDAYVVDHKDWTGKQTAFHGGVLLGYIPTSPDWDPNRAAKSLGNWDVIVPATEFYGASINHGKPRPVTMRTHLGGDVWILGLVDGAWLKLVKLKVTGKNSYQHIETRYSKPTEVDSLCLTQKMFSEMCFSQAKHKGSSSSYPVNLKAESLKKDGPLKCYNDAECLGGNKLGDGYVYAKAAECHNCKCIRRPAVSQECAAHYGLTTELLDRTSTKYQVLANSWFKGWVRRSQTCPHADQGNAGRYTITGTVAECQIKCDKDSKCKGFSYKRTTNTCFMFITKVCGAGEALPGDTPCIDTDWCNYDKVEGKMVPVPPKYVCPEQIPVCMGYVPNVRFGACVKNLSEV